MKKISIGSFLLGYTALSLQLLVMREFINSFYGNELTVSFLLSSWLLWTGAGSYCHDRAIKCTRKISSWWFHLFIAFFVPLTIAGLHIFRTYLGPPGEIVQFQYIVFCALLVQFPFCFLSGALFAHYCQLVSRRKGHERAASFVYFTENSGSLIAGFLFSILLIELLSPSNYAVILSLCNGLYVLYLIQRRFVTKVLYTCMLLFILLIPGLRLEDFLQNLRWGNSDIIEHSRSKYGEITLTRTEEQQNLYVNGVHIGSYPDEYVAETLVHYALLNHPSPKKILMIGGVFSGLISEISKYNPTLITIVELDPSILRILASYTDIPQNDTMKIELIASDGRMFFNRTAEKFDCILITMPRPCNAQINRYYSQEFYQQLSILLTDDGIISFTIPASANYINTETAFFLKVLNNTVSSVFKNVALLPGERVTFLASNSLQLRSDADFYIQQLESKKIATFFVNQAYLPFELTEERKATLNGALDQFQECSLLNRDFHPLSYYFDIILWGNQIQSSISGFFWWLFFKPVFVTVILLLICSTIILKSMQHRGAVKELISGLTMFIVGYTILSLEILFIITIQIVYGFAYYVMSLIVTIIMLGLTVGSFVYFRSFHVKYSSMKAQQILHGATILVLTLFALSIYDWRVLPQNQSLVLFFVLFLSFPLGLIGGIYYPLAVQVSYDHADHSRPKTGTMYWFDLFGSSLGAFTTGLFFLPLFGLMPTTILLILLNFIAIYLLFFRNGHITQ